MQARLVLEQADQALLDLPEADSPELDQPPIEPLALPEMDWRASFAPALLRQQTPAPRQIRKRSTSAILNARFPHLRMIEKLMELLGARLGISRTQAPTGEQVLRLRCFEKRFHSGQKLHRAHARRIFGGHDHHRFAFL